MNKHPLLLAILVLLLLTSILSIVLLAFEIKSGYTGFTAFNNQPNKITLT
jgi:hypothetical protein